jgi:hypothetical protein
LKPPQICHLEERECGKRIVLEVTNITVRTLIKVTVKGTARTMQGEKKIPLTRLNLDLPEFVSIRARSCVGV